MNISNILGNYKIKSRQLTIYNKNDFNEEYNIF